MDHFNPRVLYVCLNKDKYKSRISCIIWIRKHGYVNKGILENDKYYVIKQTKIEIVNDVLKLSFGDNVKLLCER